MVEQNFKYINGDREKISSDEDFPYGLQHDYVEDLNTQTTSSSTFQDALTLTTADLPAGNYMVDWVTLWGASTLGGTIEIQITLDGIVQWVVGIKGDVSVNTEADASGFKQLALDGIHTIELQFRKASGGGTCSLFDRMLKLERWD